MLVDLVANAFIANKKTGKNSDFLAFSTLEKYGECVVANLKAKGQDAVLLLSRDRTDDFFDEYGDLFEARQEKGERGVALCRQVSTSELIQRFRGYLPLDLLLALVSPKCVEASGITA